MEEIYVEPKKCGRILKRYQVVIFSILISIGRTIDILAISVTKDDNAKNNFQKMWSRKATIDEMDPLHEILKEENFKTKETHEKCKNLCSDGVRSLKKIYPEMKYGTALPILEAALQKFKTASDSNLKSGGFLTSQNYNCLSCLNKIYVSESYLKEILMIDHEFMELIKSYEPYDTWDLYKDICYVRSLCFEFSILKIDKYRGYFKSMYLLNKLIDMLTKTCRFIYEKKPTSFNDNFAPIILPSGNMMLSKTQTSYWLSGATYNPKSSFNLKILFGPSRVACDLL